MAEERTQRLARKTHPEDLLYFASDRLAVTAAALGIEDGKAQRDEGANFHRQLAMSASTRQGSKQQLRIIGLQSLAPALHGLAVDLEHLLETLGFETGIIEPAQQTFESQVPLVFRHHLEQFGSVIEVHRLMDWILKEAEDRVALVRAQDLL